MQQENQFVGGDQNLMIRKVVKALRRRLWLIILLPILGAAIAMLYLRYTIPIYEGTLSLQLSVKQSSAVNDIVGANPMEEDFSKISGQIEVLKSRDLLLDVVDSLDLNHRCFMEARVIEAELYGSTPFEVEYNADSIPSVTNVFVKYDGNGKYFEYAYTEDDFLRAPFGQTVPFSPNASTGFRLIKPQRREMEYSRFRLQFLPKGNAVSSLSSMLSVAPRKDASIVDLKYEDRLPERSKDVLHTLVYVFLKDELNRSKQGSRQTITFIDSLLIDVKKDLVRAEERLSDFESAEEIPTFSVEEGLEMQRFTTSKLEIERLQLEMKVTSDIRKYIRDKFDSKSLDTLSFAPSSTVELSPVLTNLINELNKELSRLQDLSNVVRSSTSVYKTQERKVKSLVTTIYQSLGERENDIVKTIREMRNRIGGVTVESKDFPQTKRALMRRTDDYLTALERYQLLQEKKTSTQISMAAIVSDSRIVDNAYVSDEPITPKSNLIIGGAVFLGLLLSIGYALAIEFGRQSFTTIADLQEVTKVPIIGQILESEKRYETPLVVLSESRTFMTETFRKLRSNLQFLLPTYEQELGNIITVTSTVSREGKTFFSLNLGGILSLLGDPVVVVDLDLRKPRQHIYMNLGSESGVTTYLLGKDEVDDIVQTSGFKNLDIITTGPAPPNPSELLSRPELDQMVKELQKKYRYIILDTSPVGLVTDALPLFQKSDINLYMVRAERSKKAYVKNVSYLREAFDIDNMYIVFNGVKSRKHLSQQGGGQYGYGYYGQGYGGYVYGVSKSEAAGYYLTSEEDEPKWWQFWKRFNN